ncbi:LOW QUALITY PROTEIN: rho GTPase-activating protein 8-like [Cyanocitta cristata]
MSEVDFEKLAEIELQKGEMDDTHSEQEETFLPSPLENPELNINHPYYDVARHGIIQLAGIALGMSAPRLPGCGPLPSLALDCSVQSQNQAIDLLIQHLPLLAELPNLSRRMEDLFSLLEQRMPEPPCRAGRAEPAPPAPPAGDVAPNQEAVRPAANPEAALPQENTEAAATMERVIFLLRYLKYTLDQYVENDYMVVYFPCGLKSLNKPSLKWLQTAYKEFDRNYKKNLKALYVVHPTNFIKILWNIFKPLISPKFGKKITYLDYLSDLGENLKFDQLNIPQEVIRHDENLWRKQKGKIPPVFKIPPPRPPLPTQQFGVSLQYIEDKNKDELTPVIKEILSYLKSKRLQVDLFRRSASIQTIKDVQKLYHLGKYVNFDNYHDIHIPAVILKTFLRELPQPLLTFDCYDHVLGITSVESCLRATRCKEIIQGLPEHNYVVLKYLICFLHMIELIEIPN